MAASKTAPKGLGKRGQSLWVSLGESSGTPGGELALEACRMADRLDAMDEAIKAKGIVELLRFRSMLGSGDGTDDEPVKVEVHFDRVLGESRQLADAFRQALVTLGVKASAPAPAKKGGVDELKARREGKGGRTTTDASANA